MTSFIQDVIIDLQKKHANFSDLIFVLPSKRAGVFLRQSISDLSDKTLFSPEILSIEEFVETISGLQYVSNSQLLFRFYDSYLKNTQQNDIESFDLFSKWAQILIQDFNEIDRYLIDPEQVFDYLSAIKEIEHQHWSLDESPTEYIKNYLLFWKRLKFYYHDLKKNLAGQQLGYQGMVYKDATVNIDDYIKNSLGRKHIFLGFNALNSAEDKIIQKLLINNLAEIYWDTDKEFISNKIHDAGLFIREHLKSWKHFENQPMKWASKFYSENKNIEIIGTPKNVGQMKYVGQLLSNLDVDQINLKKTAVVLGDESLLLPLLNSLPKTIERVNITMGLPLGLTPISTLFKDLFRIHQTVSDKLYYKDVLAILNNQYIQALIGFNSEEELNLTKQIKINNIVYLSSNQLVDSVSKNKKNISLLFSAWADNPETAITNCIAIVLKLKEVFEIDREQNAITLEYLYKFNTIFNELETLNREFKHIDSIKTLNGLFQELLKNETLDFQGEPLEGLQIMGMLETRVLDFETVILTSVNEGILPAGKSNNSFIPFDVKIENKLPTYKEKDAVYTYHFYRMLQRAKNIYLIYNTEPDVLNGGEKSRFITQLLIDDKHEVVHKIVSPKVPIHDSKLQQIEKTPKVILKLDKLAKKGFSPSSLTNYIRNPIDFYQEKVLGISQLDNVEEHIAHNTLGTVVHNSLEDFYKPFEGKILTLGAVKNMKNQINKTVKKHFDVEFKKGDITKGKNLIIFEIAKRYVNNFLETEISELKAGNTIEIVAIEANNVIELYIDDLSRTVKLTGKVDRVDKYNGGLRIIDYKTGRVEPAKVEIVNWEQITTDYDKYSKSFQVLMYCYMMSKSKQINLPVEAGIISFKNLSSGFLKFATKPSRGSRKKETLISKETLEKFEIQLQHLITEIFNPKVSFTEKQIQ